MKRLFYRNNKRIIKNLQEQLEKEREQLKEFEKELEMEYRQREEQMRESFEREYKRREEQMGESFERQHGRLRELEMEYRQRKEQIKKNPNEARVEDEQIRMKLFDGGIGVLSPSVHEVAFAPYREKLAATGENALNVDERYISLLSAYASSYGRLEQKYAQLFDTLVRFPFSSISQDVSSFSFNESTVARKEGSGSSLVVSEQSSIGVNAIVRVEIDEDPLTVEQMGLLFSTLSTLATKYWLISQGRFADLIEFTKSHDERFIHEAQAVITRISYNSPLNFDIKLSATDVAQGITTTIDGIVQTGKRFKQMELVTKTKEIELQQATQSFAEEMQRVRQQEAFEQEKRQLELARQQVELERLRLGVEQQRLELFEARLDIQSKSMDHAFEIAHKVIGQLHPQADDATKRMLVQTYVGDILQLSGIAFTNVTVVEVDQASLVDNKDKEH